MNLILLYNILTILLFPLYIPMLLFRMYKGKENIESIKSRLGCYRHCEEPEGRRGNLVISWYYWIMRLPRLLRSLPMTPTDRYGSKLIWLHAASVGESMIAITLVKELQKTQPNSEFLITTGTLSSASIIKKWLPKNVYHQFTPIDNPLIVRKFYQYWQPNLGIFIESELWPALLSSKARKCKLILLNARLSDKSFKRWQKFPIVFKLLTDYFSCVAVQSSADLEKYYALRHPQDDVLGASLPSDDNYLINLGNLKFANQELSVNKKELEQLQKTFVNKKVFVASSTHSEDEQVILDIIGKLKKDIYPIIILRHPERREELSLACQKLGLKFALRSGSPKPSLTDDVYIVDSFGELGLFYSLADIVFVGGSFKRGGHNLLEPAYFDNVIILGPDMSNFQNIADEMVRGESAVQIKNTQELQEKIFFFLEKKNSKIAKKYSNNAKKYVDNKEKILSDYLKQIDRFL